jgi:transketolase
VPSDCNECEQVIEFAAKHEGPVYVRLSRNNLPNIYDSRYKFDPMKANVLKTGSDVTIISNGDILSEVVKAVEILAAEGVDAELISLPVVKPIDAKTIIESAKKTGKVVTVENHSVIGGIGSAVCEVLSENCPTKTLRIGMNDIFGQSGTPKDLLKYYGLDSEGIVKKVLEII